MTMELKDVESASSLRQRAGRQILYGSCGIAVAASVASVRNLGLSMETPHLALFVIQVCLTLGLTAVIKGAIDYAKS